MEDDDEGLDDLFGALDGDDGEDQSSPKSSQEAPPAKKKTRSDNGGGAAAAEEEGPSRPETKASSHDNGESNGDAKALYTALMSQKPLASRTAAKKKDGSDKEAGTKEGSSSHDDKKEISTGTSHDKSVRSYSAYPKNLPPEMCNRPKPEKPKEPAKTYAFELDPFQQQAINYIDREESVLVAAHTSAGKTAVAEYAIARSLKKGQRVVYTSPIKALSNQKFRDLQEEFGDVGLMTGDITINPTATCLVMTTEILRSMLYRGSEIMREVAWAIFDEVHYLRDAERGVVWEESIILLPHQVGFVFLSATIPNAAQFAEWIAKIHHQPCHVVYTNYRPVPLQHYIFPQGGDGLHLVVDERGKFREANFQKAMATLQGNNQDGPMDDTISGSGNGGGGGGGGGRKRRRSGGTAKKGGQFADLHRIVKLVMERNLNPVIIFSFSKKDCERFALALNKEDYTDDIEKDLISQVYTNAIDSLSEDDRKLPQVQALLPLLKRGIGIHHGGLLPILKEIVEILFSEGLIKALFATETFAIGINMPAKTVVFTNTRKWDGKDFRWVSSGEYIQMSGRAGRRGKDDRGIVIQMFDEKMEPDVCKGILYGEPDPLNSSYRISYNMLLNLMRVEDVDPEYLLRASFHQFQREQDAPGLVQQAEDLEQEASQIVISTPEGKENEEELASEYFQMDQQLLVTRAKVRTIMQKPEYTWKFLQNGGRILDVTIDGESFGWGVLVSSKKSTPETSRKSAGEAGRLAALAQGSGPTYNLEVLLFCVDRHFDNAQEGTAEARKEDIKNAGILSRGSIRDCRPRTKEDSETLVHLRQFSIGLDSIERLSAVRIFLPKDISTPVGRKKVALSMKELLKRFPDDMVPLLDPVKDMGIEESSLQTLLGRASALGERLASHKLSTEYSEEDRVGLVESFSKRTTLREKARGLREHARACQTIVMKDDLKKMKKVLKKLGHVDGTGVIQTKGRTACEINTANELVVVELVFAGVFNELAPEQCTALLSCMTYDERNKDDDDITGGLKNFLRQPFHKLRDVARTVVRNQISCKVELDEEEFVASFNPGMMEAVFAWSKGAKFIEVQKLTKSFEGTTIRTLRRLEELIRQIASASKAIGNQELQTKFEKAGELVKRDIVFCSSLYL